MTRPHTYDPFTVEVEAPQLRDDQVGIDVDQVRLRMSYAQETMQQVDTNLWVAEHLVKFFSRPLKRFVISAPSTPWQALKARYAPRWVLKRWPVKQTTRRYQAVDCYPESMGWVQDMLGERYGRSVLILKEGAGMDTELTKARERWNEQSRLLAAR